MLDRVYQPGDWVVYRKQKLSSCPGPRAINVDAASKGEDYSYQVDKYWVVISSVDANHILVCTRRGKAHQLEVRDPNLRHANWWERLCYRWRFPHAEAKQQDHDSVSMLSHGSR